MRKLSQNNTYRLMATIFSLIAIFHYESRIQRLIILFLYIIAIVFPYILLPVRLLLDKLIRALVQLLNYMSLIFMFTLFLPFSIIRKFLVASSFKKGEWIDSDLFIHESFEEYY